MTDSLHHPERWRSASLESYLSSKNRMSITTRMITTVLTSIECAGEAYFKLTKDKALYVVLLNLSPVILLSNFQIIEGPCCLAAIGGRSARRTASAWL